MTVWDVLAVALPFVWLGILGALSFVETPLKFRAPGVTIPIGLGIGRVVFGALGRIELGLLVVITVSLALSSDPTAVEATLLAALWVLWVLGFVVLRPRLMRRSDIVIAGGEVPPSHLHLVFIVIDLVKLVVLGALGTLVLTALPA